MVLALVGAGFAVLSMTPPQYTLAQVFFSLSALFLIVRTGWWVVFESNHQSELMQPALFCFVIFGGAGVLWYGGVHWVQGLRPKVTITQQQQPEPKFPTAAEIAEEVTKRSSAKVSEHKDPGISVQVLASTKGASREAGSGFWIAYTGSYGNTVSPSNVAIYLRALNKTDNPIRITTYSAWIEISAVRTDLFVVPTGASHQIYFGFAAQALMPQSAPKGFSSISFEENTRDPIKPHAEVEGWVLFEYPERFKNAEEGTLGVNIVNDYGDSVTVRIPPKSTFKEGVQGTGIQITPNKVDMSKFHLDWYSRMYGANRPR